MKDPHNVSGYFYRGRWEKLADDIGKREGKITRFTVCKVHLLQKLFAVWKIRKRVPNLMCTMKRDVLCSSSMFPRASCGDKTALYYNHKDPHSNADVSGPHLVLALVGLGPAQPDLVLAELAGDVGDDLLHVDALARAVVALQLARQCGLQNQPQLLRQLLR
jgi:hypothetical protein